MNKRFFGEVPSQHSSLFPKGPFDSIDQIKQKSKEDNEKDKMENKKQIKGIG